MELPIINENNDEKNTILPCKDNLKIYFDGKLEINGCEKIDDRLKFDFGPIRIDHLNEFRYTLSYSDYIRKSEESNETSIQLFTKFGMCNTKHYEHEITKEQFDILQDNFVDNIINILYNDRGIFNFIGDDILDRLYSLGWQHHNRFISNDNNTLNVNSDNDINEVSYNVKKPFYDHDGTKQIEEEIITLSSQKTKSLKQVSINARILESSHIIQTDGRSGTAKYIIVDKSNWAAISENSNFYFEPIINDNKIRIPTIIKAGNLYGMDVYITKNENPFVLVGRNEKSETGLTFLPYYIEPIGYIFKDEKIKILFNIKYDIADLGFYPDLNYFMFYHN